MFSGYLRYPHVNEDQVVFVADDDLWLTTVLGGRAHRLTSEHIPVRSPPRVREWGSCPVTRVTKTFMFSTWRAAGAASRG